MSSSPTSAPSDPSTAESQGPNADVAARSLRLAADHELTGACGLDEDAEQTLEHMRLRGIKANTLRAMAQDMRYFVAWHQAYQGAPLPLPTPPGTVRVFIAHHLWDPAVKAGNPRHGMPDWLAETLERDGHKKQPPAGRARQPASLSTVRRRLAHLSTWHRQHPDLRRANPLDDADVKAALRTAGRGAGRIQAEAGQGRVGVRTNRKSDVAIVADDLRAMVAACEHVLESTPDAAVEHLRALRDRAVLLFMWTTGGRRRSEGAQLDLAQLEPVAGGYLVALGETKTRAADNGDRKLVPLTGAAAAAFDAWRAAAGLCAGRAFRGIDQHGHVGRSISTETINRIVKRRAIDAGLIDPQDAGRVSAHGLRAGFLTEAARQRMSIVDAMALSDHRSERTVAGYWKAQDALDNPAGRMLENP